VPSLWGRPLLAATLVSALLAPGTAGAAEEEGWKPLDPRSRPPGTSASSLAYDETRRELVLFGGTASSTSYVGTWVRGADETWRKRTLPLEPPNRYAGAMAYDAARREVVLFGGYGDNPEGGGALPLADTWTWDGARWEQADTPVGPSPRAYAAAAYDRVRERVVLFGGIGIAEDGTPFSKLDDTWTWDGSRWIREEPPSSPSGRDGAGMAFDEARGEVVLFGGSAASTPRTCTVRELNICVSTPLDQPGDSGQRNDTWTWDGTTWTERSPTAAPAARSSMGMAYHPDREEVVLFGGVNISQSFNDTWAWDGTAWTEAAPDDPPERRFSPAMATDRRLGRVVVHGGHRITYLGADTWGWNGSSWESLQIPTPRPRMAAVMAADPAGGGALLFGGDSDHPMGDTWTWDGAWRRRETATAPPARAYAGAATDPASEEVVLFGGMDAGHDDLDDVWVWDGSAWEDRTPAFPSLSPLPRRSAAVAHDAARGETVLFGGRNIDLDMVFADTWTFDGTSWELKQALLGPPALFNHRMVYDPAREEVVLFGGQGEDFAIRGETWTWDGTAWTEETPVQSPPPLSASAMVWDPRIERVVLFSGLGSDEPELWAWDGGTWHRLSVPGPSASRRSWSTMAFLPELQGSLLFGGLSQGYRDDTWRLRIPPGSVPAG
jgi:hypothetical protein